MDQLLFAREGLRMLVRSLKVRLKGFRRFEGTDEEICKQAIESCWNARWFQVSSGHFTVFYSRDFSWNCKSLLGHKKRVERTLTMTMEIFRKHDRIAVAINDKGKPFDFPNYAIDSIPSMMRSLRIDKAKGIIEKNKEFLEKEVKRYFKRCIDASTGLVRADKHFSSIKDHSKRSSSCYGNCMVAMLSSDLDWAKLENPFKDYDYPTLIKKFFWTGEYFLNDLSGDKSITGDSQVFPFWCGVFDDKKMLRSCITSIQKEGLDKPFPLKYHLKEKGDHKMRLYDLIVNDYETHSVWAHIGMLYIGLVSKVDKKLAKEYLWHYKREIERYGTFLEIFDEKGDAFRTPLYITDEGMVWSAQYLVLKKLLVL